MTGLRLGSLFSGYGGLDMAVDAVTGATTAWVSDIDAGACKILAHRYPGVPNLGDISGIDWSTVEPVDIVTGGFPCQDVSHAGKRAGLKAGTRTGLWSVMAEAINQLRPSLVVAENVRGLLSAEAASDVEPCPWCLGDAEGEPPMRALGAVLADLADIGYDAQWTGLRAADVGAPHGRFRVFVVAYPSGDPWRFSDGDRQSPADADELGHEWAWGAWERRPEPAGQLGRPDAAERSHAAAHPASSVDPDEPGGDGPGRTLVGAGLGSSDRARTGASPPRVQELGRSAGMAWGPYASAIRRWEHVTGRLAPAPTEAGAKAGQRLSPRFVEWMMGLPAGHVTDVPGLSRNEQLKALGNGVVPQQAAAALQHLLDAIGGDLDASPLAMRLV